MKTIEEQAAEFSKFDSATDIGTDLGSYRQGLFEGFFAGYQAAKDEYKVAIDTYNDVAKQMMEEAVRIMSPKDQLADAGKVMDTCEHILDMEKMVDVNSSEKPDGWISVKERLPEEGVGWCTVYGCILSRWAVQPGFYDKDNSEWVSRFIGGYMDDEGYAPFEDVTHWMPLPEAPKEEG